MMNIPIYLRLKTDEPLDKVDIKSWYEDVKDILPDNVMTYVNNLDGNNPEKKIWLIHQTTTSNEHLYIIPLLRDLTVNEIESLFDIEDKWNGKLEDSSSNLEKLRRNNSDAIIMTQEDYDEICETLAKHQHQKWINKRSSEGWSYGLKPDSKSKQHPMMLPWEQLPESYKNIDKDLPNLFMKLLADKGYGVVSRYELNSWLNKK